MYAIQQQSPKMELLNDPVSTDHGNKWDHPDKRPSPSFRRRQPFSATLRNVGHMAAFILLAGFLNTSQTNEKECRLDQILLTTQLFVLEDPSRSLTIEQVNESQHTDRFRPNLNGRTNFGISRSAFWFRIAPRLPLACQYGWLLALTWPLLDSIDFYWHEDAHWQRITTGARHPYASRQIDFHNFMFRFPDLSVDHAPYFIRVVGDNPLFMEMRLLQQDRVKRRAHQRSLLQGIFLGVLLGLILYNAFVFLSLRDTAYLYYVIYLVSTTLLVAEYNGIATRYLWPALPEWNVRALWTFALSGTAAYLAFVRQFLDTKRFFPRLDRLFRGYVIGLLLALAALYWADHAITLGFPPVLAIIGLTLAGFASINAFKCNYRPARFVCVANILFGLGIIWLSALTLGYPGDASDWNHFIFEFGLAVEAVLLSLALASRIKLLQQEKLSAQLALLDSKNSFANQLITAQDAERQRIAGELHDGIGQNLMVVNNRLNRILETGLAPGLAKQLNFASQITQKTIHELRGLSHRLHPHELDRLGLTVAIEAMANDTLCDAGIKVSCQIDTVDHVLDRDRSLYLYRIVQETIRNIITHAEADQVSIRLVVSEKKRIELHIADNGHGIHAPWFEHHDYSQAFGLSNICERVRLMGGTIKIVNRQPKGLVLDISIPISAGAATSPNAN